MNKDKQIEKMAKVIKSSLDGLGSGNFNFTGDEISTMFAEALYNAGYRKASEVAEEIFAEIEKNMVAIDDIDFNHFRAIGRRTFAELKKKYTEEGK